MRYILTSKIMPMEKVEQEARNLGAADVKVVSRFGQVFCDMDAAQASKLPQEIQVRPVGTVRTTQLLLEEELGIQLEPMAAPPPEALNMYNVFEELRQSFSPPLTGEGLTVAVLDTGIRKTHQSLRDKVIHEIDFSGSTGPGDVYGHGTGIAFLIAGSYGAYSGVAPGAKLMNVKVLGDNGEGTEENLIDGIDHVCALVATARARGLMQHEEDYPNTINLSLGTFDDGDRDNPVRVACRTAWQDYGIQIVAAVGNNGPRPTTVEMPACDEDVIAVGGLQLGAFMVLEQSSRGPTREGLVKPDLVCWAQGVLVASHRGDDEYDVKAGTSFSTPILTGVDGLMWELGRRVYGQSWRATWHDVLAYAPYYCIKPEGTPVSKDNDYGYGLPAINTMVTQVMGTPTTGTSSIVQAAAPLMVLMVLGTLLKGGLT